MEGGATPTSLPAIAGALCAPAGVLQPGGPCWRGPPGCLLLPLGRLPRSLLLLLASPLKIFHVDLVVNLHEQQAPVITSTV